jgi:hypothetical protein
LSFSQSSNLIGSWLQPLLGHAGSDGRTGSTRLLLNRLQLAFVGPRHVAPDSSFLSQVHDPPHRVSV